MGYDSPTLLRWRQLACKGPHKLALWLGDIHFRVEAEAVCHEKFDGKCSHGHDIVLLRLKQALPKWVQPVKIALDGKGNQKVGQVTMNIGFGLIESLRDNEVISDVPPPTMREANLTIVD